MITYDWLLKYLCWAVILVDTWMQSPMLPGPSGVSLYVEGQFPDGRHMHLYERF